MKIKLSFISVFLLFVIISLSGCFTTKTINAIEGGYETNYITEINDKFIDSNNILTVNFKGRLYGAQLEKKYHFTVNLDTVYKAAEKEHLALSNYDYYLDYSQSQFNYIDFIDFYDTNFNYINFACKDYLVEKKWKTKTEKDSVIDVSLYENEYLKINGFIINSKDSLVFDTIVYEKLYFELDKKWKKHYIHVLYLPFAIIVDIITFPFQILLFYLILFSFGLL